MTTVVQEFCLLIEQQRKLIDQLTQENERLRNALLKMPVSIAPVNPPQFVRGTAATGNEHGF